MLKEKTMHEVKIGNRSYKLKSRISLKELRAIGSNIDAIQSRLCDGGKVEGLATRTFANLVDVLRVIHECIDPPGPAFEELEAAAALDDFEGLWEAYTVVMVAAGLMREGPADAPAVAA